MENIYNLIKKCSTELPKDIYEALKKASINDRNNSVLKTILENLHIAKDEVKPICQDTGVPIFYVETSKSHKNYSKLIQNALDKATQEIPLRPNAVDPLTGKEYGNKAIIHYEETGKEIIHMLFKGGGSENVSMVYSLPDGNISANRDIDGIKRCILDAVHKAQGKGCPPYIIGVGIAGNIEQASALAKKQLILKLDIKTEFNEIEKELTKTINNSGIGPMGLGGNTTVLGIKIAKDFRPPASFFVGISFGCWALRRLSHEFS